MSKPQYTPEQLVVGQSVSYWTLVDELPRNASKRRVFLCRCICGTERVLTAIFLLSGRTKSCGCQRIRITAEAHRKPRTHGEISRLGRSPEYESWSQMKQRCYNPLNHGYARYGARGITVCERWRDSFENFLADMGRKPGRDYTIDRIDNSKGYSPDNCRWATKKQQSRNISTNRMLTANGVTRSLAEWSEVTGIHHATLCKRLSMGWAPEEVVGKPVRRWPK